jgi:hypothetical protein
MNQHVETDLLLPANGCLGFLTQIVAYSAPLSAPRAWAARGLRMVVPAFTSHKAVFAVACFYLVCPLTLTEGRNRSRLYRYIRKKGFDHA